VAAIDEPRSIDDSTWGELPIRPFISCSAKFKTIVGGFIWRRRETEAKY
jgi:hypothetical protein